MTQCVSVYSYFIAKLKSGPRRQFRAAKKWGVWMTKTDFYTKKWANHFSVQTRKESALIIEFVSESHVAELIQHQKVIDYTATYKRATTAIFGLLRPSTRISLGHTPPHGQTPSGPHTAAHGPALTSRACCAAPNGRDSIAATKRLGVDAGTS